MWPDLWVTSQAWVSGATECPSIRFGRMTHTHQWHLSSLSNGPLSERHEDLAEVYDINPELVEDQGFVEILKARSLGWGRKPLYGPSWFASPRAPVFLHYLGTLGSL